MVFGIFYWLNPNLYNRNRYPIHPHIYQRPYRLQNPPGYILQRHNELNRFLYRIRKDQELIKKLQKVDYTYSSVVEKHT
jgi:hypothetical protein